MLTWFTIMLYQMVGIGIKDSDLNVIMNGLHSIRLASYSHMLCCT